MTVTSALEAFQSNLYSAALEYLDRGWSLIPISIENKKPLIPWKAFQDSPPSLDQIEQWFHHGVATESGEMVQVFNLGVATGAVSGIVVVDADNEVASAYAEANGLASQIQVKTTRGKHYYWRHPGSSQRFANKAGGVGHDWPKVKGLDFRGDGGYVLVPPSVKFNADGVATHQYAWLPSMIDFDELDVWSGSKPTLMEVDDDFNFSKMSLATVSTEKSDVGIPVWDQLAKLAASLGGKIPRHAGYGTDPWMVKYLGEQASRGVTDPETLFDLAVNMLDAMFEGGYDALPATNRWLKTKVNSVLQMEARNHPERTTPQLPEADPEPLPLAPTGRLFTLSDVPAAEARLKAQEFVLDPIVAKGTITQIVGFNGHAKSFTTLGALFAMTAGASHFGPYLCGRPVRTLYLDYENPSRTIIQRMKEMASAFGNPGDRLQIWSPGLMDDDELKDMRLNDQAGVNKLARLLNMVQPDVVVIDTIRSAWPGLEENKPQGWAPVNQLMKGISSRGPAVVALHHRNKPGEDGLGREAGNTAQLTDIDTQVYVTNVYQKKEDAKRHAGLLDSNLSIEDAAGRDWSPWAYMENRLEPESRLLMVQELAFGKVRQFTENHETQYVGWAERDDGSRYIVSSASKKQKALIMRAAGADIRQIAQRLHVSVNTLRAWLA
jgi:hypothetical protein